MTMFYGAIEDAKRRFRSAGKFPNTARWVNPVLGLGVLTGYLLIGNPVTPDATMLAPRSDAQLAATQVTALLARGNETSSVTHSSVAHDESTRSWKTDLLNAALGTVVAAVWLIAAAWVGIHSARISTPLDDPKSDPHLRSDASSDRQADPRYQARLYYLRRAEFPVKRR